MLQLLCSSVFWRLTTRLSKFFGIAATFMSHRNGVISAMFFARVAVDQNPPAPLTKVKVMVKAKSR